MKRNSVSEQNKTTGSPPEKSANKVFYRKLVTIVLPIAGQSLLTSLVSASDALMLGLIDQDSLSAISLAGQVQFMLSLFQAAFMIGGSVLAAQYWGIRDKRTVEKVLAISLRWSLPVSAVFTLAALLIPQTLMCFFTSEALLVSYGAGYLRVVSPSYLLMGYSQMYFNIMKNSGRVGRSAAFNSTGVVSNIVLNFILIFGLAGAPALGITGAALATVLARALEVVLCIIEDRRQAEVRFRLRYFLPSGRVNRSQEEYAGRSAGKTGDKDRVNGKGRIDYQNNWQKVQYSSSSAYDENADHLGVDENIGHRKSKTGADQAKKDESTDCAKSEERASLSKVGKVIGNTKNKGSVNQAKKRGSEDGAGGEQGIDAADNQKNHPDIPMPILNRMYRKHMTPVLANEMAWGFGSTMFSVIMGHLGSDAVAANSVTNIIRNIAMSFCVGLGSGSAIMIGNLLGAGRLEEAKETSKKLIRAGILFGAIAGLAVAALTPVFLHFSGSLTETARGYLKWMLLISAYYLIGRSLNGVLVEGTFCAGGDTKFGFLCDLINMWCFIIPLASLAAFVWKLPVMAVYFILNLDEMVKIPFEIAHYRKYKWLRNLTQS